MKKRVKQDHTPAAEGKIIPRLHLREVSPTDDEGPYEGIGADLRAARVETGTDIAAVADNLRISKSYLEAIEDGRFRDLPGGAYVYGFLRSYAEYLDLEPESVIARYKSESEVPRSETKLAFPSPMDQGRLPTGRLLASSLVLAGLVYAGWYVVSGGQQKSADLVSPVPERLAAIIDNSATPGVTGRAVPGVAAPIQDVEVAPAGPPEEALRRQAEGQVAILMPDEIPVVAATDETPTPVRPEAQSAREQPAPPATQPTRDEAPIAGATTPSVPVGALDVNGALQDPVATPTRVGSHEGTVAIVPVEPIVIALPVETVIVAVPEPAVIARIEPVAAATEPAVTQSPVENPPRQQSAPAPNEIAATAVEEAPATATVPRREEPAVARTPDEPTVSRTPTENTSRQQAAPAPNAAPPAIVEAPAAATPTRVRRREETSTVAPAEPVAVAPVEPVVILPAEPVAAVAPEPAVTGAPTENASRQQAAAVTNGAVTNETVTPAVAEAPAAPPAPRHDVSEARQVAVAELDLVFVPLREDVQASAASPTARQIAEEEQVSAALAASPVIEQTPLPAPEPLAAPAEPTLLAAEPTKIEPPKRRQYTAADAEAPPSRSQFSQSRRAVAAPEHPNTERDAASARPRSVEIEVAATLSVVPEISNQEPESPQQTAARRISELTNEAAANGTAQSFPVPPPIPQETQTAALDPAGSYVPQVFGASNEGSRVVIEATVESWVQVRGRSGETLMTRILRVGDRYLVPNRPNLVMMTGNAGALKILVDGEEIGPLGPPGAVLRNVALEPSRLLARASSP